MLESQANGDGATQHGASPLAPLALEMRLGTRLGGYQLDDLAGRGGMGVVYRAKHLHLERTVALKVLIPELARNVDFRERFLRESRTAASIHHPGIITVYDAGEAAGLLYIAMRFVEGPDLAEVLRDEGALEPRRAVGLLTQIAAALDAAHAHGVIHRDVKPANVMIDGEQCYLTDFGLTKRISSQTALTARGQFVGTVDYTAPEQIQGGTVDARTDVYALGCLAYHALTGTVPYERESDVSVIFAHVNDRPPSLIATRPDLPTGLGAVLDSALAKRKEDRPESCGALVAALRGSLYGTTASVGRPAGSSDSAKVLVVAEKPRSRALVRASVAGRVQLLEAADRTSALALASAEQPAVVLLDYGTAGGSGAEICGILKAQPATAGIHIIAIVGSDQAGQNSARTRRCGSNAMRTSWAA